MFTDMTQSQPPNSSQPQGGGDIGQLLQLLMQGQQQPQQSQGGYGDLGSALQQLLMRRMERMGMAEQMEEPGGHFSGEQLDPETLSMLLQLLMSGGNMPSHGTLSDETFSGGGMTNAADQMRYMQ
jgi:hypothetical protein